MDNYATLCNIKSLTDSNIVPYFGAIEPYFYGNGITGASTEPNGDMSFLIGPDYTSPNFLQSEILSAIIDGSTFKLNPQMHRIRNTGVFYGEALIEGICFNVYEITNENEPFVARIITATSKEITLKRLMLQADISPNDAECTLINSCGLAYDAIQIMQDTTKYCFGNKETLNWAERSSYITFNLDCTATQISQTKYILTSKEISLINNQTVTIGLYHYQYYNKDSIPHTQISSYIKSRNALEDIMTSIHGWKEWIESGNNYNEKIHDQKCSDVIQSLLLCVKMQQNRDGGVIAGIRKYANSYVRDTYGCSRILSSTGHYIEVKKIIMNIYSKWEEVRFIPNWWSMGSNSFIGHSFNNDAAEVTAYYVLMVQRYFEGTTDFETVEKIFKSIKWAIDVQVQFMKDNNWLLDFNGDETEQYCCNTDGEEYGGVRNWNSKNWSFSSACVAIASIDFYIDYLKSSAREHESEKYIEYVKIIKNRIDEVFWNEELSMHCWSKSKEDNSFIDGIMTNYSLIPLWIGSKLNNDKQIINALSTKKYINENGFLPNCVGISPGFCGHSLGYLLYDLILLKDEKANDVYNTILNSNLLSAWGTISEFYGPGCVPNGHNFRGFEGGILGEALLKMHMY